VKVRVNGALLRFTDYRPVITVPAPTVQAALTTLADQYQPLGKVLFDREGKVRATYRIFLNGATLGPHELGSPAGPALLR
jgi:hypothetical protein